MIVSEYIKSKFQTFGINISDAELLEMSINGNIETSADLSADNMIGVSVAIAEFVPTLLLRPQSVTEGGFSQSFNPDSLKEYYFFLCRKYDLPNRLAPTATFMRR